VLLSFSLRASQDMQKYTFEPIPEGTIVLFRESERDPYWCQVCGEKYKSACSALAHGRKLHSQDERTKVTTVTGQKPVSSEAKLSWRQAYLEGYRRKQQVRVTADRSCHYDHVERLRAEATVLLARAGSHYPAASWPLMAAHARVFVRSVLFPHTASML
jgi:hypothetical protein